MKITYIYHSSFLVECRDVYLLFDYFKGQIPQLKEEKPLVVFASHRHADHFSEVVFELAENHPNIWYVLSSDIWKKRVPEALAARTLFMGSGKKAVFAGLEIETLKSTDEGVAWLINCGGRLIYHAGDLNDWTWPGESEKYNRLMRNAYRRRIEHLQDREIDLAFVVLDSRQGAEYSAGMTWFLQHVKVKSVIPMHCWEDYSIIEKYRKLPEAKPYLDKISVVTQPGQEF